MPINPHLLAQAAKGTPAPLNAFLPAFQQAQDRKLKQDLLQEERGMRLAKMKQDWTEYFQEQQDRQKTGDREAAINEIMAGDGTYEEKQAKLAERGFLDEAKDVGGLIPDDEQGGYNLQRVWNDNGEMRAIDPRNPQSISEANAEGFRYTSNPRTEEGDDSRVWAAYLDPESGETLFGRFTDRQIDEMRSKGVKVSPSGQDPSKTAEGLSSDSNEELGDRFVALNSLIRNGNKILETASKNPNSVAWAGDVARFGNTLLDNASRLMDTFGIKDDTSDKESFIKSNENLFGDVAKGNALLKALIYDVAYSYMAATKDQSGRGLSDQDVKNAINIISADTPETLSNNLRYFLNESRKTFSDLFRARSGEDYKGKFGEFEPIWEPAPSGNVDEVFQEESVTRRRYDPNRGVTE